MLALGRAEELGLIDLEQRGGGVGALEIAAEADELPALAVNHGGVADALEEMNAVDDGGQRVVDAGAKLGLRMRRVHLVEEAVEALPLLGGDFFADLAGVFAGGVDAEGDGGGAEAVEDQRARPSDSRSPFHSMPAGLPSAAMRRCQRVSALAPPVSSIRLMVTSSWRTVFSARSR